MSLTRRIAWRYLRSKKSHGAVSAIAAVSIAGVAIATAAVVCVLSVFNGFRDALEQKFDTMAPDIAITPMKGKVMQDADSVMALLADLPGLKDAMPVVSDKALALYGGRELPVTIKGVDPAKMAANTGVESTILPAGRMPAPYYEEMPEFEYLEDYEEYIANTPKPEALASIGAAVRIGSMVEGDSFLLFAPRREGRYNPANPAASFVADSVKVSGIFETRQREYDEDMVIVPIGLARHLFQYGDEATSIELALQPGADMRRVKAEAERRLGGAFKVRDRREMQEVNFRMINIEKWVSFLLLVFILMIAGFNIISTMTMLVLEKRRQLSVMSAIGMRRGAIGAIFSHESMMVGLTGGVIGIALGIVLCLIQQEFGVIHLAGDPSKLLMTVYPVKIVWGDVALAFVPCVVLGLLTALIASRFARQRITTVTAE